MAARAQDQCKVKVVYSQTGLYVLMNGSDKKVTATITEDFADLWPTRTCSSFSLAR